MKRLWLAAALAPLAFAAAAPAAHADTTISSTTSTPQTTSADGNITISGTIDPKTGPAAVTVDSSNNVTNNGSITYSGVSDATGILVNGGYTGAIDNAGSITIDETTTGDSTYQGIEDGPFANGSDRFGIAVVGNQTFDGSIITTGSIAIIGENSAGIDIAAGMSGQLLDSGAITVTGGNFGANDVSYGIIATGPIAGNVTIAGAVTVTGTHATGVELDGGVGGELLIDDTITATGFRSTTPPYSPTVLAKLYGNQTALGGPALVVGGTVTGGIDLAAAIVTTGNVTTTPAGVLTVYGSAPAMIIGGAEPISIGTYTSGVSVNIGGSIVADGDYPNVSATGLQIGGSNPLPVTVGGVAGVGSSGPQPFSTVFFAGALDVSGSITASSISTIAGEGDALALDIGQGANVPNLTVTGTIESEAQEDSTPTGNITTPVTATAIQVDPGATKGISIVNAGSIYAAIEPVQGVAGVTQTTGGQYGTATAINDVGGAVYSIMNTGNISATVTPTDPTQTVYGQAVALYTTTDNVIIYAQCSSMAAGVCALTGNGTATPSTTGELIFAGAGPAVVDLWAGDIAGGIEFGQSAANSLDIENGALFLGNMSQAPGSEVALDIGGSTAAGGELFINAPVTGPITVGNTTTTGAAPLNVSTLNIGAKGVLVATVNPADIPSAVIQVSGNATLAAGAGVGVTMTAPISKTIPITLIQTSPGNLTLAGAVTVAQVPFLFSGALNTSQVANGDLILDVSPKTAQQLGFNPAEASAFNAIYAALGDDSPIALDVLSKTTKAGLLGIYGQFLPDYEGGIFETMVQGQRTIARTEGEPTTKLESDGVRGWVQEIGFLDDQDSTAQVNGYQSSGTGLAGGIEKANGNSAIGVSAVFLTSSVKDNAQAPDQSLTASAFEAGVYARYGGAQGLMASASLNGGWMFFGSRRFLIDVDSEGVNELYRQASASWQGVIASADVSLGYQITMGRLYARPEVSADYTYMSEGGYAEHGGGPGMDLAVAAQTNEEADVQADLVLGANFGQSIIWRPELTIGYHAIVSGGPAATNAKFVVADGGQPFTLNPVIDKGGVLGRLGVHAGGLFADFTADAGGEFRGDYQAYDARAMARFLF